MFKRARLQFVLRNYSRFRRDAVWENAQDLEHVPVLHPRTNSALTVLGSYGEGEAPYAAMAFRTRRRLFILPFYTFGFRKIVAPYQIQQIEYIPGVGIHVILNSQLRETSLNGFQTEMVDEVILEVPFWLSPLKKYFEWSLRRHTRIQCEEDEPFRERREELRRRGIALPYRFFRLPFLEQMARGFRETPS